MKSLLAGPASCSIHAFSLLPSVETSVPHLKNCGKNLNLVVIIRVWVRIDKDCTAVKITTNRTEKTDTRVSAVHQNLLMRQLLLIQTKVFIEDLIFLITWYGWYAELSVRKSNCRSSKNSTAITGVSRLFPTTGLNACVYKKKKTTLPLQNQLSETCEL